MLIIMAGFGIKGVGEGKFPERFKSISLSL